MSATGGNFVLGKETRRAKAQSLLTANAAAPALTLANNGTQAATAINPKGASGKAPMTVNESAGTATNLSADEPDGKSGGDFYVAGGKVADASRPHAGEDMRALAWTRVDPALARDGEVVGPRTRAWPQRHGRREEGRGARDTGQGHRRARLAGAGRYHLLTLLRGADAARARRHPGPHGRPHLADRPSGQP